MTNIMKTYELLPIELLKIDKYQRILQPSRVKEMVNNFDERLCEVIKVSLRNGVYNIFDGQHRYMACKLKGIKYLMCEVHRGLTFTEEAILFERQDENRKGVSRQEKFKSKVIRNESYAISLKNLVESIGFKISPNQGKHKNSISAVTTLEKIDKNCGREILERTLRLIWMTWNGIIEATDATILIGVSGFLKEFGSKVIDKDFVKFLSRVEPKVIIREAKSDLVNKEGRYKVTIQRYYNKNRTKRIE